MSDPRIAVGYTRVSTEEQAKEGLSLGVQELRIEQFAAAHGWSFSALHSDPGRSGTTTKRRPGLEAAMADVCAAKGVLVIFSLSRLARSVIDAYQISRRLESAGADLASVTEPIDTSTAMGRAFFGLLAIFAQLESEQTGERIRAVNAATVAELGYRTSGSQQYGRKIVDRQLVPVPSELAVIRDICNRRAGGATMKEIADWLNDQEVPTPARSRGYRLAGGDRWSAGSVHRIVGRVRPELLGNIHRRDDHVWTDEEREVLGTMTDSEVAELLGCNRITVWRERKRLGIASYCLPGNPKQK